jgi:hypothetical protein
MDESTEKRGSRYCRYRRVWTENQRETHGHDWRYIHINVIAHLPELIHQEPEKKRPFCEKEREGEKQDERDGAKT